MSSGTAAKGHSICAAQTGFRLVMVGAPAGFEPALMAPGGCRRGRAKICTAYLAAFGRRQRLESRSFRLCSVSWLNQRYGQSSDGMLLVGHGAGAACQPEKRKVDSSILSLTTNFGLVSSALTSADADWAPSCPQPSSDHDCPCVTVVGRSLSPADRTSRLRAPGSRPLRPEANARCEVPPLLLCLTCLAPSVDVLRRPLASPVVVTDT